jgi:hypothetical protein
MPNLTSIALNPNATTLLTVTWGANSSASITVAEINTYISGGSRTDAQIETQIASLLSPRWARTGGETITVKLLSRSPLQITILVSNPGVSVPANWWA